MSWTLETKNSSNFTGQTKNTSTFSNATKSGEEIYFVAENGTFYLMGLSEDLYLVTQDPTTWVNTTKN